MIDPLSLAKDGLGVQVFELFVAKCADEEAAVLLIEDERSEFFDGDMVISVAKDTIIAGLKDDLPLMDNIGIKLKIFTWMKR